MKEQVRKLFWAALSVVVGLALARVLRERVPGASKII
jgi:hypothetical protein